MSKKEQLVTLVTPDGRRQAFSLQHAERLLGMGSEMNGGWKIADNEKYYYDNKNGIRHKSDKTNTAKAK